jgi:hypothetical protein
LVYGDTPHHLTAGALVLRERACKMPTADDPDHALVDATRETTPVRYSDGLEFVPPAAC